MVSTELAPLPQPGLETYSGEQLQGVVVGLYTHGKTDASRQVGDFHHHLAAFTDGAITTHPADGLHNDNGEFDLPPVAAAFTSSWETWAEETTFSTGSAEKAEKLQNAHLASRHQLQPGRTIIVRTGGVTILKIEGRRGDVGDIGRTRGDEFKKGPSPYVNVVLQGDDVSVDEALTRLSTAFPTISEQLVPGEIDVVFDEHFDDDELQVSEAYRREHAKIVSNEQALSLSDTLPFMTPDQWYELNERQQVKRAEGAFTRLQQAWGITRRNSPDVTIDTFLAHANYFLNYKHLGYGEWTDHEEWTIAVPERVFTQVRGALREFVTRQEQGDFVRQAQITQAEQADLDGWAEYNEAVLAEAERSLVERYERKHGGAAPEGDDRLQIDAELAARRTSNEQRRTAELERELPRLTRQLEDSFLVAYNVADPIGRSSEDIVDPDLDVCVIREELEVSNEVRVSERLGAIVMGTVADAYNLLSTLREHGPRSRRGRIALAAGTLAATIAGGAAIAHYGFGFDLGSHHELASNLPTHSRSNVTPGGPARTVPHFRGTHRPTHTEAAPTYTARDLGPYDPNNLSDGDGTVTGVAYKALEQQGITDPTQQQILRAAKDIAHTSGLPWKENILSKLKPTQVLRVPKNLAQWVRGR